MRSKPSIYVTVNKLRDILREIMLELLVEISGGDLDVGLELRPEVVEELLKAQRENRRTVSHQQLMSDLASTQSTSRPRS